MSKKANSKITKPRDLSSSSRSLSTVSEEQNQVPPLRPRRRKSNENSISKRKTVSRPRNPAQQRMERLCEQLIGEERIQEQAYLVDAFQYMRRRERETSRLLTSEWLKLPHSPFEDEGIKNRAIAVDTLALTCFECQQFRSIYMAVFLMDIAIGDELPVYYRKDCYELEQAMMTAFFMAIKFNEMDPIDLEELELMMRSRVKTSDIFKKEASILQSIDYRLNYDSEEEFLNIYSLLLKMDDRDRWACHYLLEVGLYNPALLRELPSKKAVAAVYLHHHLLYMDNLRECPLKDFTGYKSAQIRSIAKEYLKALIYSKENRLYGVRHKYELTEYSKVGQLL